MEDKDSKWFVLFFAYIPAIQAVEKVFALGFSKEETLMAALEDSAADFLRVNPECGISRWELAAEFLDMLEKERGS
jgi:hypothetical protein